MSIDGFDLSRIGDRTLIPDVFRLLWLSLRICVVSKCICVVNRVLFCCFLVRGHLEVSYFFGGFAVGGLWFFCFVSFLYIVLLMLSLSLLFIYVLGVTISGCVFVWIWVWFAKGLVDVFKWTWHFGDCSLTFFFTIEFDCQFLDEVVIAFR